MKFLGFDHHGGQRVTKDLPRSIKKVLRKWERDFFAFIVNHFLFGPLWVGPVGWHSYLTLKLIFQASKWTLNTFDGCDYFASSATHLNRFWNLVCNAGQRDRNLLEGWFSVRNAVLCLLRRSKWQLRPLNKLHFFTTINKLVGSIWYEKRWEKGNL